MRQLELFPPGTGYDIVIEATVRVSGDSRIVRQYSLDERPRRVVYPEWESYRWVCRRCLRRGCSYSWPRDDLLAWAQKHHRCREFYTDQLGGRNDGRAAESRPAG